MKKKYSPSPWKWEDKYRVLIGSDGSKVLEYSPSEGMWLSFGENQEGNSLLMEAAPVLLEALLHLRGQNGCECGRPNYNSCSAAAYVDEIISRAQGKGEWMTGRSPTKEERTEDSLLTPIVMPEKWNVEEEWCEHEELHAWYITSRDPKFVSLRVYTDTPEETARKICNILNREMP